MNMSQIITREMEVKGITAYKLSQITGLSQGLIGYYKTGKRDPSSSNLLKIADALNVSVDYLLGRTDKPEINR